MSQIETFGGIGVAHYVNMRILMGYFIILIVLLAMPGYAAAAKKQCKILISEAVKKEQLKKDEEQPDRFETKRDWATKILSDKDPTWKDPEYLARIQEFLVPNITNYGGKAHKYFMEYQEVIKKFFQGDVLNFTSNGTDANNMLFLYAEAHLTEKLRKKPTHMKILSFADIYG